MKWMTAVAPLTLVVDPSTKVIVENVVDLKHEKILEFSREFSINDPGSRR